MKLLAIVKSRPSAIACWSKMWSAIGSSATPYPRTSLAASESEACLWSGVVGKTPEPVRKKVLFDPRQRGDALYISKESAIAYRYRLAVAEKAFHRYVDVPELTGHARRSPNDVSFFDHAAAEAGPDDGRYRRAQGRLSPEEHVVGIKSRRIAVIVVDDRNTETRLERRADIEAVPGRLGEVRRAFGADDAVGARRPWRAEPDGPYRSRCRRGKGEHGLQRLHEGPYGHIGSLFDPARALEELADEKVPGAAQHRGAVARAAVVQADHGPWLVHPVSHEAGLYPQLGARTRSPLGQERGQPFKAGAGSF